MPCKGRKFISEFLLPCLNAEKFGSRLKWLDVKNQIFQVQWNHKSASDWTESDAAVFAEWDKRKGHYNPGNKEYYSKSKQRFRAVLYKFIRGHHITELCSKDKHTRIYCIGAGENIPRTYKRESNVNESIYKRLSSGKSNHLELLVPDRNSFNFKSKEEIIFDYRDISKEEIISDEEKVITGYLQCNISNSLHSEAFQENYVQLVNLSSNNCSTLFPVRRETSKPNGESDDMKSLYIELIVPDMMVFKSESPMQLSPPQDSFQDSETEIAFKEEPEYLQLFDQDILEYSPMEVPELTSMCSMY